MPDWQEILDKETLDGKSIKLWQHVVAGSVAGAVEHAISFPFDALAARSQYRKSNPETQLPPLMTGWLHAVIGSVPAHAAMFASFETIRTRLSKSPNMICQKAAEPLASVSSVLMHDLFDIPMHLRKRRIQKGVNSKTALTETKGHTYRGLCYSMGHRFVESSIQGYVTEYLTKKFEVEKYLENSNKDGNNNTSKKVSMIGDIPLKGLGLHFLVHGMSGAVAAGLSAPFDVVRTELTVNHLENTLDNTTQVLKNILKNDGLKGVYRGVLPRMAGAMPEHALSWGTFEIVERVMRRASASSKDC